MQEAIQTPNPPPAKPPGPSIWAILRRRWWMIALIVVGALATTLELTLTAPPAYRSSLRLQASRYDIRGLVLSPFGNASFAGVSRDEAEVKAP